MTIFLIFLASSISISTLSVYSDSFSGVYTRSVQWLMCRHAADRVVSLSGRLHVPDIFLMQLGEEEIDSDPPTPLQE